MLIINSSQLVYSANAQGVSTYVYIGLHLKTLFRERVSAVSGSSVLVRTCAAMDRLQSSSVPVHKRI